MGGTILVVLLIAAAVVAGYLIYKNNKPTVDREAKRISNQAQDVIDKAKEKVKK